MNKNKPEINVPSNQDDDLWLGFLVLGVFLFIGLALTGNLPSQDFFINNALLGSFIINSLICFNKGLNFKSLYSAFDLKFDNASLKPFFSFTYYLASIFYARNLLLIILMFDSSTFFQSIIISTGAFIGLKLFLDTLVSIFKK